MVEVSEYAFPYSTAEDTFMSLLAQRDAIRNQSGFDINDPHFLAASNLDITWVRNSIEVYGFVTRSPLAALLNGLLARATDADADPFSLQAGSGPHGFTATRLWKEAIRRHGQKRIYLNKLKDQPFNNSPWSGKRRVANDWENTSPASKAALTRLTTLLTEVEAMDTAQARQALLSVLVAAPDPPVSQSAALAQGQTLSLSLTDFAEAVREFILLNSDDGRRAQAFVTAVVEVALPGRTTTPESVNDPSRSAPGDVKSHALGDPKAFGPLFVEVKDKVVRRTDVDQFIKEVQAFDEQASVGYAALANDTNTQQSLPTNSRIPDAASLTREFGIPVLIWLSTLELLSQAAAWTAIPMPRFLALCAENYLRWLEHIDTGRNNSPEEWANRLRGWGLLQATAPVAEEK